MEWLRWGYALLALVDRTKIREELAGLHELHAAIPELHVMPGHDAAAIDSFLRDGLLVRGF